MNISINCLFHRRRRRHYRRYIIIVGVVDRATSKYCIKNPNNLKHQHTVMSAGIYDDDDDDGQWWRQMSKILLYKLHILMHNFD